MSEFAAGFKIDTEKLDQMIRDLPGKFAKVVSETAFDVLTDAKKITPRDPARPPKNLSVPVSGALRANSGVVIKDGQGLVQNVEYYQEYAPYQELGAPSINLPARPFLTPAVEGNAQKFFDKIAKVVNE